MPEPQRHPSLDPSTPPGQQPAAGARREVRPFDDDPLEELARILGETGGYPARPETMVEIGRQIGRAHV